MKSLLKNSSALVAVAFLLQPLGVLPAAAASLVTLQPLNAGSAVSGWQLSLSKDPVLSNADMAKLVRDKIKYVFVIFNENNSFDHEYGTFPGANGLYSDGQNPRSAADTPGFNQSYTDVNSVAHAVHPFRLGPQQNSTFIDSTDHSHTGLAFKLDVTSGVPKMDKFAQDEYNKYAPNASASAAKQAEGAEFANVVMAYVDCDTIPFFWQYANRFTIFDNIFATEDTPSSPNAIAMIAGQSGETQWVKEGATAKPNQPVSGTINDTTYSGTATPTGVPVVGDSQPWWGSAFDTTVASGKLMREPTAANEFWAPSNTSENLTFANVLLTLGGDKVTTIMSGDQNAAVDQKDIANDIPFIEKKTKGSFSWRWYQNGYEGNEPHEPFPNGVNLTETTVSEGHLNYVSHHNGAQYFGYISNNENEQSNIRGEKNFFEDVQKQDLPDEGGVFYLRGGYYNIKGQTPPIQNSLFPDTAGLTSAEIQTINYAKSGDDDHPSYSDKQLSEAMAARAINAIAKSKYWKDSAIIITYDESDGGYDHVPPDILSYGPDSLPLARGIRIPLILISPYARAGAVSHAEGDHNAIIETINSVFGLPPLSSLPEEAAALTAGNTSVFNDFGPAGFQQRYLGPRDTNSATTDSLLSGFSSERLKGTAKLLPASYAEIPDDVVETFPHFDGQGCAKINVTPTDANLTTNAPPANFNTLPSTLPAYSSTGVEFPN